MSFEFMDTLPWLPKYEVLAMQYCFAVFVIHEQYNVSRDNYQKENSNKNSIVS